MLGFLVVLCFFLGGVVEEVFLIGIVGVEVVYYLIYVLEIIFLKDLLSNLCGFIIVGFR